MLAFKEPPKSVPRIPADWQGYARRPEGASAAHAPWHRIGIAPRRLAWGAVGVTASGIPLQISYPFDSTMSRYGMPWNLTAVGTSQRREKGRPNVSLKCANVERC